MLPPILPDAATAVFGSLADAGIEQKIQKTSCVKMVRKTDLVQYVGSVEAQLGELHPFAETVTIVQRLQHCFPDSD